MGHELSSADLTQIHGIARDSFSGVGLLHQYGIPNNRMMYVDTELKPANYVTITGLGLAMLTHLEAQHLGLQTPEQAAVSIKKILDFFDAIQLSPGGLIAQFHTNDRGRPEVWEGGHNPYSSVDTGWTIHSLFEVARDPRFRDQATGLITKLAPGLLLYWDESRKQFFGQVGPKGEHMSDHHYDLLLSEASILAYLFKKMGLVPNVQDYLGRSEPNKSGEPVTHDSVANARSSGGTALESLSLTVLVPDAVDDSIRRRAREIAKTCFDKGFHSAAYREIDGQIEYVASGHGGLCSPDASPEEESLVAHGLALPFFPKEGLAKLACLQCKNPNLISEITGPSESHNSKTGEALAMPTIDNLTMIFLALAYLLKTHRFPHAYPR